jgi:hypothetical protein
MMIRIPVVLILLSFATAVAAAAEERKQAFAVRAEPGSIRLDGRLDEAAWSAAAPISDFTQRQPDEGVEATERTEVRFAYDDAALYVGARMYSSEPSKIAAPITRRDQNLQAEHILISLDTFLDRRTAVTFGVTAAGTRIDRYHPGDSENVVDSTFDPVWEAVVQRDAAGWTAEMRIPLSQLRFLDLPVQTWGLNVRRSIPTKNEHNYWVMVPRRAVGWASRFGELTGLEIRPVRRVEILPYVSTGARYRDEIDPANPFDHKRSYSEGVGADFKFGLGSNVTIDATVNPDFAQVEADPAVINLSAFEIQFPERRPFFVEGAQLLRGTGPRYFYSRRVGAAPPRTVAADYVDYPSTTGILGAAKLIGRFPSGTSLGGLFAITDHESARIWDESSGTFGRIPVAARSVFGVLRGEQQFGRDQSTVGFTMTSVTRDFGSADRLSPLLSEQSFAGGADWTIRFRGGEYELTGHAGGSYVEGSQDAIARLQRSSARYFQRPDAGHVEYDPTRTKLSGHTGSLRLARLSGKWLWSTSVSSNSPGFEINDAGLLSQADTVFAYGNLRYRETAPRGIVRDYEVGLSTENLYNHDGTRSFAAVRSDSFVTWRNFWWTSLTAWFDFRSESDRLTRGGPLMGTGEAWVVNPSIGNSSSSRHLWRLSAFYGESELGEETLELRGNVSWRTSPSWQLSVEPIYFRSTDPRLYFGTLQNGPAVTYDRRYLFSSIDRDEIALRLRANYALRPDLTFELYTEPFVASGSYHDFGELPAPRSRDLRFYGEEGTSMERLPDGRVRVEVDGQTFTLPNRDYNVRSFRSNAVLRWEWRPGSTAYLVWQQDRFSEKDPGRARFSSLGETFSAAGDQILHLKVSYWIPW